MSATPGSNQTRPLPLLHGLIMIGLALLCAYYCWLHAPSQLRRVSQRPGDVLGLDRVMDVFAASLGDLLLGFCTLLLFGLGTGIYVRRFQVWLDARSSGQAVAYGSADLKDQAVSANLPPSRSP
jgi:hypothetical protein